MENHDLRKSEWKKKIQIDNNDEEGILENLKDFMPKT